MLNTDTYIEYLETLVISLIKERDKEKGNEIICVDMEAPPFTEGRIFKVYSVINEIETQRLLRNETREPEN